MIRDGKEKTRERRELQFVWFLNSDYRLYVYNLERPGDFRRKSKKKGGWRDALGIFGRMREERIEKRARLAAAHEYTVVRREPCRRIQVYIKASLLNHRDEDEKLRKRE